MPDFSERRIKPQSYQLQSDGRREKYQKEFGEKVIMSGIRCSANNIFTFKCTRIGYSIKLVY